MSSLKEYQVEILGSKMVVDLDEMMGFIKLDNEQYSVEEENDDGEFKPEFAINAAKYEMLRLFLDVILSTNEEIDEKIVLSRCSLCNTILSDIRKSDVEGKMPKRVFENNEKFWFCPKCDKIYWMGSHYEKIINKIAEMKKT